MKKASKRAPWPVIILIAAFLCPTELSLYIAGLRFPPHRVALFILFPIAIVRLFSQRGLKLTGFDIFFVLFNVWITALYMHHQGAQEGLVYGGSQALESLGGYLVARVWVRTQADLRATMRALGWAIFVAAMFALPEFLLGKIYTHEILHQWTGYYHPIGYEQRLGFTRAYSVFDHPIHYGTFCATMAAMYWYAENTLKNRIKKAALLVSATIMGLSSAPLLCLGLQGGMLVWDRMTKRLRNRAVITFTIIAGLYIGASLVSTRGPIAVMATSMTLDPWTGFYRLQIWENGIANVWQYPLIGIGLADWQRPAWMVSSTIDAFWLVIMLRTGVPSLLLLIIGFTLLIRRVNKHGLKNKDPKVRNLARGWMMSFIALSMISTTVHLWNVPFTFFFFFVGCAGWIADPLKVRAKASKPVTARLEPEPQDWTPTPWPQPGPMRPAIAPPPLPAGAYAY
jgi:hypothetical protein